MRPQPGGASRATLAALPDRYSGSAKRLLTALGFAEQGTSRGEILPFGVGDATAGTETELQAVVVGGRHNVDLPRSIENSRFYSNVIRRAHAGELASRAVTDLERYLAGNPEGVWENSWVCFPASVLNAPALKLLESDLRADKADPASPRRADFARFFQEDEDETSLRIPVSYLLRLSLADALGESPALPSALAHAGASMLDHFLSDNTSPETFSFYVVRDRPGARLGDNVAREKGRRLVLTQALTAYANSKFGLTAGDQRVQVYLSPLPPLRQRTLNEAVSDSFYRELFMSPCLSGWDRGEDKHRYMELCHQVLSRSQLNCIPKLREAGIITNNLVVLPNTSTTSLANNGTHVSLGSRRLSALREDPYSGFGAPEEKYLGDLVTKIVEHFLPLFVGTYSAAPYRIHFSDFHPERVLGFLPHGMHYTHLRMLWRRWKGKADLSVLGHSITPFGPRWVDTGLTRALGLRGDFVPDYRLVDYLVSLMSTEESPALDGTPGNGQRLKADLAALGTFDPCMALYLPFRQREHDVSGYAGFEARHYSVFESFRGDLAPAVELQRLLTLLAFRLAARGTVDHGDIPDTPFVESERRQVFFGTALGIPTFFVRQDTPNRFLQQLLRGVNRTRKSHRYPGYVRVYNLEYRRALLEFLLTAAPDLVEETGTADLLADLRERIDHPETCGAAARLVRDVVKSRGASRPLGLDATEFNRDMEDFYRVTLRDRQVREALGELREDLAGVRTEDLQAIGIGTPFQTGTEDVLSFLDRAGEELLGDHCSREAAEGLIRLVVLTVHIEQQRARASADERNGVRAAAPVC
ncbi:MAG: hypothetical protein P1P84_00910 [Deferrisomatales bacterium]|nr:hypothetical protein [Deferrisomatales bacterium]